MMIVFAAIIEKSNSTQSFVQIQAILQIQAIRLVTFPNRNQKILQEIYNQFQPSVTTLNIRGKRQASPQISATS